MNRKIWLILSFALIGVLSIIGTARAHGVVIEHRMYVENGAVKIEIHADFDSGEVMSDAQVAIFAPNDLINPWQTGKMDEAGNYTFEPDLSIPGTWDVQVRKAGHGDMIHIKITGDEAKTLGTESEPPVTETKAPETSSAQPGIAVQPLAPDTTKPLESPGSIAVGAGQATDRNAPLVQIIVNDGSVLVSEGGTAGTAPVSVSAGYSTTQIIVMAACVIWGFVGTALFFARKGRN